ncbi:hypothetical protein [Ruegeria sp. EL01]|uniref:hypothetical protein n=1 Tax=Ruegeria sp. EL01 TaxID=2107578 RepID=UPI000EA83065|nr:hypothetical protein [Ruegeria sp. EL01]
MKHETIQTRNMAGICTAESDYGKLKVEQNFEAMTEGGHHQLLASASPNLALPPQGQDGQTAHPSNLDDGKRAPVSKANKGGPAMKDEDSIGKAPSLSKELGLALEKSSQRSVEIDTSKYQKYLDDPALTDDQKEEIVVALWSVITGFMDLGFGIQPMQEVCGKNTETVDHDQATDSNGSKPKSKTLQNAFNAASDDT